MDSIEPILPHHSILPEVRAATRAEPIHRDGHQRDGGEGQRRRRNEEEAVEVDVEGVEESDAADAEGSVTILELPAPRLVDVTADAGLEPPVTRRIDVTADANAEAPVARRIDVTDDDDGDPPAHRVDLSV